MVLPPPAADAGAAEAAAYGDALAQLDRLLTRARQGLIVLLQATSLRRLGATVRGLCAGIEPWDPACALQVCLRAEELERVPDESRVLLRVQPEDAAWLNLRRPLVADKKLRLVLWADEAAMAALVREAVDFYDWISREITVPAAEPEALAAYQPGEQLDWDDAAEQLKAAGWNQPARLAGWLGLVPARIELARRCVGGPFRSLKQLAEEELGAHSQDRSSFATTDAAQYDELADSMRSRGISSTTVDGVAVDAVDLYRRSLALRQAIVLDDGPSPSRLRDIFASHIRLATAYAEAGDTANACSELQQARATLDDLESSGWSDAQTAENRARLDTMSQRWNCP